MLIQNNVISIIVPVYNVENYLHRCIDSILVQTYSELEILLIDDGSTDNCRAICDAYAQIDNRVKVIHQTNRGLSAARNAGIDIATGKYFAFVDSDDYLSPHMYETLISAMKASNADIVMCNYLKLDVNGQFSSVSKIQEWSGTGKEYVLTTGLQSNYAWNKLFSRDVFENIRFPVGKYFEDTFIMHEVFFSANSVRCIPDVLYMYCSREESIAYSLTSARRLDFCESYIMRLSVLIQNNPSENALRYHLFTIFTSWRKMYFAGVFRVKQNLVVWKNQLTMLCSLERKLTQRIEGKFKIFLWLLCHHPQVLFVSFEFSRTMLGWLRKGKRWFMYRMNSQHKLK